MDYEIEFIDDLMTVVDEQGYGQDAYEVDGERPWDAVEKLAAWGRQYDLDACQSLKELRTHLKECYR